MKSLDFFKYVKIYRRYLGVSVFFVFIIAVVSSLLEAFGLMAIVPLFMSLFDGDSKDKEGFVLGGLDFSNEELLMLALIAFSLKGCAHALLTAIWYKKKTYKTLELIGPHCCKEYDFNLPRLNIHFSIIVLFIQ